MVNIGELGGWRVGRHRATVVTVGLVAITAVAACGGPGASSPGTSSAAAAPSAVSTNVADQAATLTFFSAAGLKGFEQGLADAFHAKYPKITVNLQVEADNNYNTVLPRLLASDSPPDVVGPSDLIGEVKDGLLTNLDSYDKAYGWAAKLPSTVLAAGRVQNGVIGSGSLYQAGGAAGPLVGVFYNKDLAAKVGMTAVPASIPDLEAVMAKAKADGITPIVASNSDGLVGHLYALLLGNYMGPQALLDVIWHKPGATLNTPEAKAATATLDKWAKAGYFNPDANAINQDGSYGQFAGGKGLFMFQGTWITQALPKAFDGKYGIFPMPPNQAGGKQVSMTGNSLGYAIAAKSKNKDAAGLFLDFLSTPDAAQVAVKNGYPALGGTTGAATVSLDAAITDQIQAGYSKVGADNGFDSWLQNSAPAVATEETAQLQLILAGKTTPDAAVTKLQDTYAKALKG
jgi:raffinose/stachyose/melibiose transport system substrate-binding protein